MGEAAKLLDMQKIVPLEKVLKPEEKYLKLINEFPEKADKNIVETRQTIGKLFLELEKLIPSLRKLEDKDFHYVPKFRALKSGFFGVDYNPFTREISGYIIDRAEPYVALKFKGQVSNQHFGRNAMQILNQYKINGDLEGN